MPRAPQEELPRGPCGNQAVPFRTRVHRYRTKVRARKCKLALLLRILSRAEQVSHRDAEKQDDGKCLDRTLGETNDNRSTLQECSAAVNSVKDTIRRHHIKWHRSLTS